VIAIGATVGYLTATREIRMPTASTVRPTAGIIFILLGMLAISINDVLIKQLSDGYPIKSSLPVPPSA